MSGPADTQLVLALENEAGIRLTAAQLARELGQPPPTPEQVTAIEAPLEPCVVVAGAGSGKTETMAARVVWLVANDLVRPEQILGLTFTRKAARELAARIRRRLGQLRMRGFIDPAAEDAPGDVTVSTYDAYAGRIVAEHALRLGREPSPRLLTEAIAWQYADRVVRAYDGPMDRVDRALSTVTRDVVDLHGELSGHLVGTDTLRVFTEELIAQVEAKPRAKGQRTRESMYSEVRKLLDRQRVRLQLLPLVEAFDAEKRRREAVDFADQSELAARLADAFDEVGSRERERYPVVLLDEYQDTSHAQLVLLRGLFGAVPGHTVMAVGDPCQSIYGWRGASAQTLETFGRHFRRARGSGTAADAADDAVVDDSAIGKGDPGDDAPPAPTRSLTTSFRNGSAILEVANVLSAPLREAGLAVPELTAHEVCGRGSVFAALHATVDDEARSIATLAAKEWNAKVTRKRPRPTIAVLVRQRSQIDRIVHALRAEGLPVEVVGVGGLLTTPAVSDAVATLQVLADPTRGDALVRLLGGSRWRIGPRDLEALGRWARRVAPSANAAERSATAEEDDVASIIDALDAIGSAPPEGVFSAEGHRRLRRFAEELRGLRRRAGQSLLDLVSDVIRTLRLDIEVAARTGDVAVSRADLDAFCDVVVDFTQSGEDPTLPAFLSYLDAAADEERGLDTGQVEVDENRVQVLTVHGAKGLEWDVVFVPGMVDGVFPSAPKVSGGWLSAIGELPYTLRGDAAGLPTLRLDTAGDQQEVEQVRKDFVEDCQRWARREERRLAYVAVTRAKRLLVASGYRWGEAIAAREPGEFLSEIADGCRAGAGRVPIWRDDIDTSAGNPLTAEPRSHAWPYDPLTASRRAQVQAGAELVGRAMTALESADPGSEPAALLTAEVVEAAKEWQDDVDLLLTERARRAGATDIEVVLPEHLSVSQLVLLRKAPSTLAQAIRRPVPRPPNPLARRGTAFHAWLEARFGMPQLLDIDELPGAADDGARADDDLAALQEAFLESAWADRQPTAVEVPFELVVAGVVVRGRADAVFPASPPHPDRPGGIDVVDWKTGRPPHDPEEAATQAVQLAAYRLAWAEMSGLPLPSVQAAFHYVRHNLTVRPVDLLDRAGLEALITSVPTT